MQDDMGIEQRDARDVGADLVSGHRRQVLLAAEQEAESWVLHFPPGPLREEQERVALALRNLREAETGAGAAA